jgi:UDP-N-acetylmuramoylalanine--D-glutamate ligase
VITAKAFADKHYAVYGLARSGIATVKALLASGAKVTAWDDNADARAKAEMCSREGRSPVLDPRLRGDTAFGEVAEFDSLVISPGVPLNRHPIAARARDAGVEIIGDIELFARARPELPPHKVVGITGTNGKSTTTALVHHILKTAGVPSAMGGNIGLPILAQDPLPEDGVYVLELSSFQMDLTQSLDCDVAVLLNITPDHLDRYDSFEAYAASKARLLNMQSKAHCEVLDWGAVINLGILPQTDKLTPIEDISDHLQSWGFDQASWPALQGPHNLEDAGAAIGVCSWLNVDREAIKEGLCTYPGLPNRMERVREKDGVAFVNDSKATNAEAAAPALAAYPKVRWILGGQAKSDSLGDTAAQLGHVVKAYTIGEAGPMFARLLRDAGVAVEECETLENATKRAAEDSQSGEVVLLSPASASFDQFRDFEARGDRFRELVEGL